MRTLQSLRNDKMSQFWYGISVSNQLREPAIALRSDRRQYFYCVGLAVKERRDLGGGVQEALREVEFNLCTVNS